MVSFEGIEMAVVTFQEKDVTAGVPVAMDSDGIGGNPHYGRGTPGGCEFDCA